MLRRAGKGGLGGAYRAGFTWGLEHDFDAFVEIDCDFSHDPAALPVLLTAAQSHEVVIGSRYVPGGRIPQWKLSRRLLSRGGNQYASIMLGLGVADSTAGLPRLLTLGPREDRRTRRSAPMATVSKSR